MRRVLKKIIYLLFLGLVFDPKENLGQSTWGSITSITLGQKQPLPLISSIINWLLSFLGLIFMILIIYGGFLWMTAHGEEEQITKAKNILKSSMIGLAIVMASYGIAKYVFDWLLTTTST